MTATEVIKKMDNVKTEKGFWKFLNNLQKSDDKIMIDPWEKPWLTLALAAKLATFKTL